MVQYWVRKGATRYPKPRKTDATYRPGTLEKLGTNCNRNYLLDLDELQLKLFTNAIKNLEQQNPEAHLMTVREAAKRTNRKYETIAGYVKRFKLKKYYLYEGTSHYLIDGEELADAMEDRGLDLT
jgi:hypothetical protein